MANRVRLDFKKESGIEISDGKAIEGSERYYIYICNDGISAWVGDGLTLEAAIDDANAGDDRRCILDKMQISLSQSELREIEGAFDENYTVHVGNGYKFDARKPVTLDNILNKTEQEELNLCPGCEANLDEVGVLITSTGTLSYKSYMEDSMDMSFLCTEAECPECGERI